MYCIVGNVLVGMLSASGTLVCPVLVTLLQCFCRNHSVWEVFLKTWISCAPLCPESGFLIPSDIMRVPEGHFSEAQRLRVLSFRKPLWHYELTWGQYSTGLHIEFYIKTWVHFRQLDGAVSIFIDFPDPSSIYFSEKQLFSGIIWVFFVMDVKSPSAPSSSQ